MRTLPDYTYDNFTEPVRVGRVVNNMDRSGNTVPFIPKHQYGVSINWQFLILPPSVDI